VTPSVADALAGRWVGRPRIVTIDVDIELEFTRNAGRPVVEHAIRNQTKLINLHGHYP